jgi:uncharacterized protein YsxB (DUF464 family)
MTTITIQKTGSNEYKSFHCEGHSGYAESGSDIVCAAISILVINTINSIESFTKDKISVNTNEKTGLISCKFNGLPSKESTLLLDAMLLGLKEIEKQYKKKYIKLKFEEV